ncbi:PIN domain-containing protein [Tenacibaculum maritimum]|uniref:PIN domain-containing protein n=1 Tax=Tenacibaculum maritimum TaxID=107401 RepID=UPI0038773C8C
MKDTFPGYSRKTETEIKKIWQDGIIVFDTNVLLNLYRYSKATRETIIDLIKKFKDKIWLPHQAALEYNRNRYEVISDQEKAYKEFIAKVVQIQKDLQSTSKPPFLSETVHLELNSVFDKVNSEVEESITKYCDYLKEDPIYSELSTLFKNRIIKPFDEKTLASIFKEGEERFKKKIPPGYEDEKSKDGNRKYGDLVLWKQVLEKAKELSKPVLLITDERKTDWWWKIKDGRNMGPRHELVAEMHQHAKVDFHMYSSERFLSYGQSFLEEQINEQALKEIQAMKKAEMEEMLRIKHLTKLRNEKSSIENKNELKRFLIKRDELRLKLEKIERQLEMVKPDIEENIEAHDFYQNLSHERRFLKRELRELNHRIHQMDLFNERNYESDLEERNFRRFLRRKRDEESEN